MKETICRIIGIRGRTTIPFIFRKDLKITDDTFLRWERSGQSLIVTPLREFKDGICVSGAFYEINNPEEIQKFVDSTDIKNLRLLRRAVLNKLKTSAGKGIGNISN